MSDDFVTHHKHPKSRRKVLIAKEKSRTTWPRAKIAAVVKKGRLTTKIHNEIPTR